MPECEINDLRDVGFLICGETPVMTDKLMSVKAHGYLSAQKAGGCSRGKGKRRVGGALRPQRRIWP